MKNNLPDDLYKKIADEYVEEYGRELKRQSEKLNNDGTDNITPRLDSKIREVIYKKSSHLKKLRVAGLVAAVLVIALVTPRFIGYFTKTGTEAATSSQTQGDDTRESSAQENKGQEEQQGQYKEEVYEKIALSFSLPENLTVSYVEQDKGETIYHLKDRLKDDVVLTLKKDSNKKTPPPLYSMDTNGYEIYLLEEEGYQLITFHKEDILYTMTCEYDINTIFQLTKNILM